MSFPFTLNGHTYTEAMFAGLGYMTEFPNVAADIAAVAVQVAADAVTAASQGASLLATSTTSTLVGTGARTFTTQASKQFQVGMWVLVVRTSAPTTWMLGQVTSYSGTSLSISVSAINGSGTYTDWSIGVSGPQGAAGSITDLLTSAKSSAYTAVAGDKGTILRCTGTWTLALTSAATLASGWWCWVVNDGTGVITVDPSAAQTVNGVATVAMYPGEMALLQCNGTLFTLDFPSGLRRMPILNADTAGKAPISRGESLFATIAGPGGAGAQLYMNYAGSLFVGAPSTGTAGFTSPDGVTWTARTWGTAGAHSMYAYGASTHVTGIAGSTSLCRSTDSGVTWGAVTAPASFNDVAFVGSNFVATLSGGATTTCYSSPDGSAWTARTLPTSQQWSEVASNGSIAIAIGGSSNAFASSADGVTWTARTGPAGVVASSANMHVANGRIFLEYGGRLWWTTDAVTWTEVQMPAANSLYRLGMISSVYVAITSSAGIFTSTDLTVWAQRDTSLTGLLSTAAFSASSIVASGSLPFSIVSKLLDPSPTGLFAE